jgi:hypothetical protein
LWKGTLIWSWKIEKGRNVKGFGEVYSFKINKLAAEVKGSMVKREIKTLNFSSVANSNRRNNIVNSSVVNSLCPQTLQKIREHIVNFYNKLYPK